MNDLKLSLIQSTQIWEDPEANRELFESKILNSDFDSDIYILPEMFTTGFTMSAESYAEKPQGITFTWMRNLARKTNAAITGSYIVEEGGMYFNRLLWAYPNGECLQYNKKHLFRMANENTYYTGGGSRTIVEYHGWKILPLICYDLRFPEWCRNHYHPTTKELDYDLILFVANWPAARIDAWDTLLKARAIENHSYSVGVNRIGIDGSQKLYDGHSSIYDPKGNHLAFSKKDEIINFSLSKDDLTNYRNDFPFYLDAGL